MDWAQVLSIVLPILFAIIVGIFYQNKRFEDLNNRFEDMNRRFEDMNRRFEDMNRRFEDIYRQIGELREDIRELRSLVLLILQRETILRPYSQREEEGPSLKEEKRP